ncbi:MAG: KpsF/GutQ family sugar-phosphate isomerase [Candidatus Eisenbacteria sp.]|nr:KpsF/GutQ family sugar-phosphate isomerase [Candidatus Eisenbacteria bacterium]
MSVIGEAAPERVLAEQRALDAGRMRQMALEVADAEVRGIGGLKRLFESPTFIKAVEKLHHCRGRILIFGLGKSGLAGQRIASSLRSTGSPSIFIHPVEALHGDLGIVDPDDIAILISKSGENPEVLALIPTFRRLGVSIIGMTTAGGSELGRSVDVLLDLGPVEELAPLSEVPTVSTTLFQVIGDALTVILCRLKGFTSEDFAFLHPGGILGRKVNLRVGDVMHSGVDLPKVREHTLLAEALVVIMEKRLGMTTIVDASGQLVGILTDGDLKRILHSRGGSIENLRAEEIMTRNPKTIEPEALLVTALKRMETNHPTAITSLVVADSRGFPIGVVHLHDCLTMASER